MQQPNGKGMEELLRQASKQVGTSPQQLKQQVESGKMEEVMKKLPKQQAEHFQHLLNHPEQAKKLLETPQAKMLMKKFFSQ